MPVVRFRVRNEYGHADPELYGAADRDDPEALLEGVAMAGLAGVLRQLGDLAEFAAGIFHNLHEEVMATSARGNSLTLRVQQLEAEFPAIEKAFLSQTRHFPIGDNTGIDWHPSIQISQNLITSGDMPRFILDSYEECRGPPRLFMLDKFDVAGAGACSKRYSDPSFFKMDSASSGAMEHEIQREKRPRKTKRKILPRRNGENMESFPDPHVSLLNHMHPEKAQTVPAKRVKLKSRPLNNMDTSTRSYMERVLESSMANGDVLHKNMIEYPPLSAPADTTGSALEILASTVDVPSNNFLHLDKKIHTPVEKEFGGKSDGERKKEAKRRIAKSVTIYEMELLPQSLKGPKEKELGGEWGNGERNEETQQIIVENVPIDKVELFPQSFGSPERIEGKYQGNAVNQLVQENPVELKQHVLPDYIENMADSGSDVYVSDDIASELDNYMDALANIESEIETDSENKMKPQFSPSEDGQQDVDCETRDEKKSQSQPILYASLSEDQRTSIISEREISYLANSDSLCILSESDLLEKGHDSPVHVAVGISSVPADEDCYHDSSPPLQVDEVHSSAHENQISSSNLPAHSGADFGGEHDLISEQGSNHVSKTESQNLLCNDNLLDISIPMSETEASCSSLPMHSSPSDSGTQGSRGTDHMSNANPYATSSCSTYASVVQQSDFTHDENPAGSDKANLVSSISYDADVTKVPIKCPDSDFESLLDNFEPTSTIKESPVQVAPTQEDAHPDVSHEWLLDAEKLTSVTNSEDTLERKPWLGCAMDPSLDMLTTYAPTSDGCSDLSSWISRSYEQEDLCQSEKHEIDNVTSNMSKSTLDVSHDTVIGGTGTATAVSTVEDSEYVRSTSVDIDAISSTEGQTSETKEEEMFPKNALSPNLPIPFSPEHNPSGSPEFFSDAIDNDGSECVVTSEDHPSLSSNDLISESPFVSTEEPAPTSDLVSDLINSEGNNYEHHYSPSSKSSVQPSKDSTLSDSVSEKYELENDKGLCSVAYSLIELVTSNASGMIGYQKEEKGESIDEACDDVSDQENVSLSGGKLAVLNKTFELHLKCEQDVNQEVLPKHGVSPGKNDDCVDVFATDLLAQKISKDPCHGNEVEICVDEKETSPQDMISASKPTNLDLKEYNHSPNEEVKVAVTKMFAAVQDRISHSSNISSSDTMKDIILVQQAQQSENANSNEDGSVALPAEFDAVLNLESLNNRTAEVCTSISEPSSAETILSSSASISCEISSLGAKENPSDQDSQLNAVQVIEQLCFSHASQTLIDPETVPNMTCTSSLIDGSKVTIGTDSSVLKPSSESLGSVDKSNVSSLHLSTDEEESLDAGAALCPMGSSSHAVTSVSSPNLSMANPILLNVSEPLDKGFFNFPVLGSSVLHCNLDDAPPLPPLPPLQWRMGKPKISPQGSMTTTSKSLFGPNTFATISTKEHPVSDPETLALLDTRNTESCSIHLGGHEAAKEQAGAERCGSIPVNSNEVAQTMSLSLDATDVKIENSLRRRKALQDEITPSAAFAPVFTTSEVDSQQLYSISYREQMQLSGLSGLPPTPGIDARQNYYVMPQNMPTDFLHHSNPFLDAPVVMDPRYQYAYRVYGGESFQPLAAQEIIPRHGFYMPVGKNVYGPYSIALTEMAEKPNGRPLSILNRPRDPLIEAVASHDKSTLKKVSEIVQTSAKPKEEERNTMLDQIKEKSFNLKRTSVTRPSIKKGPTTNLKVAAIIEKANSIRQAFAGSDDEDNWSDG